MLIAKACNSAGFAPFAIASTKAEPTTKPSADLKACAAKARSPIPNPDQI